MSRENFLESVGVGSSALVSAISKASSLSEAEVASALTYPKELAHGDLAFPCFSLAKQWKVAPPECAKRVKEALELPEDFERVEIVGPYLNFFRRRAAFSKEVLGKLLAEGIALEPVAAPQKIIVEYSSPNIAKPFHIGHLRTTLIGHAIDRILRSLGHEVVSINHLGDWGTQFGFVYAGCALFGKPKEDSIFELVNLYVRATGIKKAQEEGTVAATDLDKPDVNQMARDYFLRLEAGDKEATEFWQWCLDISLQYLRQLYARLEVHFDHYTGESFYRDKLDGVEKTLRDSGMLEESRGALGVDLGKKLGFVRVFAEDGRSLYITRDLATADYRYQHYDPDKVLYVVGAPQTQYFMQLIEVLKRMKHPIGEKMQHVAYGNVPGISTRGSLGKDDKIWLHALLDEARDRALEAYRSQVAKKPEGLEHDEAAQLTLAESVGLGAVAFNYMCRGNTKEFHFSWDEALSFQGDTGPYVQYAVARINGIEQKAKLEGIVATSDCNWKLIEDDSAYQLVQMISKFQEVVELAGRDCEPYHVANYVLDLARAFSLAYRALRVVGEDKATATARLSLFAAVRGVLTKGMYLIGVPVVDRM